MKLNLYKFCLLTGFVLLIAGCSQVASGSADDDEADVLSDENINRGKSSSSGGSAALESSGSNENRSSSSFIEQSSSSEKNAAYSSSSEDLIVLEDGRSYVAAGWTFADWQITSHSALEFVDSAKYVDLLENQFEIPEAENRSFGVYVDTLFVKVSKGGFYLRKRGTPQRYVVSFKKPKDKRLLLGVAIPRVVYTNPEYVGKDYEVIRVVEPIERNDRLYYPLDSDVLDSIENWSYFQLYNEDYSLYKESITQVLVADENIKTYPLEFNINLIVVGKYMGTWDGVTPEELADRIFNRLNEALNPGGVRVRNIDVLYTKDHPTAHAEFPDDEPFVHTRNGEFLKALAHWPGHEGEINLVLGYYVNDEIGVSNSVAGYAPIAGKIYYEGDDSLADYVSIATHTDKGDGHAAIAYVALHEIGHYLGLNHTSESNGKVFDNFDDTPECHEGQGVSEDCPDAHYLMSVNGNKDKWYYSTFTPQQMDAIRFYLSVTPHK